MTKRMLIDTAHSEETRVSILDNNKLEEFLYESSLRKPLKGNIFLAKVTRVEPSLQAAFVNFGGNRHAFLPFSEIHPDYFRIPVADQEEFEAMQREQLEEHDKYEEEAEETISSKPATDNADTDSDDSDSEDNRQKTFEAGENASTENENAEDDEESDEDEESESAEDDEESDEDEDSENVGNQNAENADGNNNDRNRNRGRYGNRGGKNRGRGGHRSSHRSKRPENFGDDEAGQASRFRFNVRRKYKIQEVIKRGQVMLIQVSREERGNKGAAVSTYLSLPGRYCVLMPNSPRGGGVSRKISNYEDRSKMKELLTALEVPAGMSTIVRTAGVTRTKTEVKRDLDYLMRLWNSIRELTLKSTAPALVYEEADLIKRAMRDLYTRDIEEVLVAGEEGHKIARDFMKMLMPTHSKKIKLYDDQNIPLFQRYQVEQQIAAIGETQVTLPSGGYLVINPTEALVSIDVNSGRSTKERNIEGTALKTNLEAAEEVARQLRLRDLGGLVVIDFIDMENRGNNAKVERKMRDALANDKARVQVGRISSFGLMELSRQRLSASLNESQYEICSHCEGKGLTRTADATSLLVMRAIEAEGIKKRAAQVIAHVPANVALYLLNHKRSMISDIETRYDMQIMIRVDDNIAASNYRVEVSRPAESENGEDNAIQAEKTNAAPKENREQRQPREDQSEEGEQRERNRRGGRNRGGRGRNRNRSFENNEAPNHNIVENENDNKESDNIEKADNAASVQKPTRRDRSKKEDAPAAAQKIEIVEKTEAKIIKEEKTVAAKSEKKPAAKKKEPAKKSDDGTAKEKASNDDKPKAVKEYEVINQADGKKRKGWWNKLTE
jgi:ribonuclease E